MFLPATKSGSFSGRAGFTLVELLVSIVLVTILMFSFSRVFSLATETIIQTRGLANNDEKARTLTTILKSDLETRTFRTVIPFAAGETEPGSSDPDFDLRTFTKRQGYIYYSENDVTDDTDDVLQLTVDRFISGQVKDTSLENLMYGNAIAIGGSTADGNQPIWDDFNGTINADDRGTGASQFAEVAYFVRNGSLYRRVLLIRKPADSASNFQPDDGNPLNPLISGTYDTEDTTLETDDADPAASDFWRDFDYSAYIDASGPQVEFNGIGNSESSLVNDPVISSVSPLSNPFTRFGFDHASGQPREYVDSNNVFIGRYTHQETSDPDFGYPGRIPAGGSPMDATATATLTVTNGVVDTFEDGPRISEDLLLSNVLSFDVKLWDEELGKFVDVGHSDAGGGLLNVSNVAASSNGYGPKGSSNNVFDTWHPAIDLFPVDATNDPPPYRPDDGTDPLPIRAIQITIRYHDIKSDKTRQLTIQHSLIDN